MILKSLDVALNLPTLKFVDMPFPLVERPVGPISAVSPHGGLGPREALVREEVGQMFDQLGRERTAPSLQLFLAALFGDVCQLYLAVEPQLCRVASPVPLPGPTSALFP